jgi:hypothetical protein
MEMLDWGLSKWTASTNTQTRIDLLLDVEHGEDAGQASREQAISAHYDVDVQDRQCK